MAEQNARPRPVSTVKGSNHKHKFSISDIFKIFFTEDIKTIKGKVWTDVVAPGIKKTAYDTICNGANWLINGQSAQPTRYGGNVTLWGGASSGGVSRVITSTSLTSPVTTTPTTIPTAQPKNQYTEILFEHSPGTRDALDKADTFINEIQDWIDLYGDISVLDVYSAAGISPMPPWTSDNIGWTSTGGIQKIPVDNGYVVTFPKPVAISHNSSK